MKAYFLLLFKLSNRKFKDSGVTPWIVYLLLSAAFTIGSLELFDRTNYAPYIYSLLSVSTLIKLGNRRQIEFLSTSYSRANYIKIRSIENILVTIPFAIILILQDQQFITTLLMLTAPILLLLDSQKSLHLTIPTPFYNSPFEFTAGFRKTFLLIVACYTITTIGIVVTNFALSLITLPAIHIIYLSYFGQPEDEYFVWNYSGSANNFLFSKIKTALKNSLYFSIPIVIVLLFFFPENWFLILPLALLCPIYLIVFILMKYTAYPNEISIGQSILFMISVFFPPLLLLLISIYYKMAIAQTKTFLQ